MLKNGSTFMPSEPMWTSRTQNRPEWSRVNLAYHGLTLEHLAG
jgi:hypothetical protein